MLISARFFVQESKSNNTQWKLMLIFKNTYLAHLLDLLTNYGSSTSDQVRVSAQSATVVLCSRSMQPFRFRIKWPQIKSRRHSGHLPDTGTYSPGSRKWEARQTMWKSASHCGLRQEMLAFVAIANWHMQQLSDFWVDWMSARFSCKADSDFFDLALMRTRP